MLFYLIVIQLLPETAWFAGSALPGVVGMWVEDVSLQFGRHMHSSNIPVVNVPVIFDLVNLGALLCVVRESAAYNR